MTIIWAMLWWLAVIAISLVAFLLISFAIFVLIARYQVEKFMFTLPWLKWLTLDDLGELGLSEIWAYLLLPVFHQKGYLETRLIDEDDMHEYEHDWVERYGFSVATVYLYEFKLTKRKNRKKKLSFGDFSGSLKGLMPTRA